MIKDDKSKKESETMPRKLRCWTHQLMAQPMRRQREREEREKERLKQREEKDGMGMRNRNKNATRGSWPYY